MTAPTDFDSFAFGFNLTAANYSGGAGGTFANLVSGGEDWTVNGATPSFSTKSGSGWSIDGMDFANSATESILGQHRALYESTLLIICQHSTNTFPYGGTYAAGNSFGMGIYSNMVQAFNPILSSGYASFTGGQPNVLTVSWSPFNGTTYAQANNGTPVSATAAAGSFENARTNWADVAIGRYRTTYFSGWIARVLVFNRALHYRDNANLQSLIATEMASIGL
jgi:hypothetical protein